MRQPTQLVSSSVHLSGSTFGLDWAIASYTGCTDSADAKPRTGGKSTSRGVGNVDESAVSRGTLHSEDSTSINTNPIKILKIYPYGVFYDIEC